MKPKIHLTLAALLTVTALVSSVLPAGCKASSQDEAEQRLRSALDKNPGDVEARMGLARVLMEKDARSKAVAVLREGMKDDPSKAPLLDTLAEVYFAWGRGARDPRVFDAAERFLKERVDAGTARAETFKILGYVQKRLGRYENSIDSLAVAFELDPGDAFNKARLGYQYALTGRYEKGLPLLSEAVEQGEDHFLLWWWLGDTQRLLGDYDEGLENLNKAIKGAWWERRSELNKTVVSTRNLLLSTKGESAVGSHRSLGDRHRKLGRPDRAIVEYKKALELTPADEHDWAGWLSLRVALSYQKAKKYEEAIDYAQQAIEHYKTSENHRRVAQAYAELGNTYYSLAYHDRPRWEELLKKSINAREMQERYATKAGDTVLVTRALTYLCTEIAEVYGVEDPRVQAYRERIVQRIPKTGPLTDSEVARAVDCEARMRLVEGNYAGAVELYEMLGLFYANSKERSKIVLVPSLYNTVSYLYHKLGNTDEAMKYGEKSVTRLTELRSILGVDDFKRTMGGDTWRYVFSHTLVPIAMEKGDKQRAFDYVEQYKGRALLDLLGSKGTEGKRDALSRKRRQERIVLAQVRDLEEQVEAAQLRGDSPNLRSFQRTLSIEKTRHERLAEDVSAAESEVMSFQDVASLKAEQLRPLVERLTFVSYVVGDHSTCVSVLSEGSIEGIKIDRASEETLPSLVEAFRKEVGVVSVMSRDLTLEVEREKEAAPEKLEKAASEELYELLIEPVLPYIKTKLVYISPDSVLNYLPFEALQKDGRYLIEDYSVAYTPSGSVLKICMDRNRDRRESVLALGNPNLRNPAFRLVHAENEVNSLKGLFPKVDVYTGDDATEGVVQERGGEYDILHFACHGELNLDDPMLTSLRLAPDDENDGYLHAGEVFEHDLSASLVVLSACNSALGELTSGNELMGLTRSFLYAGVPSIVASLWTVDDRSTSYLMEHFYKNLATMNKADALREAKLETMKKYPGPFHWAAFCLQGDYR